MSTQSSWTVPIATLHNPEGILRRSATTTINFSNALRPANENSELERDDAETLMDPENKHGPGLELDTILQLKTETETQRDSDYNN